MPDINAAGSPQDAQSFAQQQEGLRRNRMDIRYKISLNSNQVIVPPFCTCCMKPTPSTETVSYSVSQKVATKTVSINLPVCPDCLAHRKKAKRANWLLLGLSSLAALVSVVLLALFFPTAHIIFWIFPLLIAAAVYVLLGLLLRLPKLGDEHSAIRKSAQISGIDLQYQTLQFVFTNWQYANLFAQANAAYIAEEPGPNQTKRRSYLQAAEHPAGIGALTLVFTAALLLIFGNYLTALSTTLTASPAAASAPVISSSAPASSLPPSSMASAIPASSAVSSKVSSVRSSTAASSKTASSKPESKTTSPKPNSSAPASSTAASSARSSYAASSKTSSLMPGSLAASSKTSSVNYDELNEQRRQEILIELETLEKQLGLIGMQLDQYEAQLDVLWEKYQQTGKRSDYDEYRAYYDEYLTYYEQNFLPLLNQYEALQAEYTSLNPKG